MAAFVDSLRNGSWLTRERIRLWAWAALIAAFGGVLYVVATSDGLNDRQGRPLGTDFANVYAAGTYVREGRPELAFDPPAQHAREREIFGAATPFYGWHYPPFFLFVAGLLALLPYPLALAVWQGVTLGLYLLSIRAILCVSSPSPRLRGEGWGEGESPRARSIESPPHPTALGAADLSPQAGRGEKNLWLLFALAYPAVFVNLGHGHNGFLTAALMGGALVVLDHRPLLAGVLFGLLAYKPQFGLMIPLVLIATGRWRTFAAAAVTVALLALAATLAFGMKIWPAFLASTHFTRIVVLEAGDTGWHKIQSVFSWVRTWGGSVELAYVIQAGVTLAAAIALIRLWRSAAPYAFKAAGLTVAALIATPYSLDYDMMALAPAIAFVAAGGLAADFRPWEKTVLAVVWLVPLVARIFTEVTSIPLGAPAMILFFIVIARHASAREA